MAEVKIEGLAELKEALKLMPEKIADRVLLAATMAGAEVIRKQAMANAPLLTGRLKANIIKRRVRGKQGKSARSASVDVGVRSHRASKKGDKNNAYYWFFVENGTSKMDAKPFLRPAFDQKKEEAATAIKERLAKRIEKEAIKLGRSRRMNFL